MIKMWCKWRRTIVLTLTTAFFRHFLATTYKAAVSYDSSLDVLHL
jgi:hypothetical protein